MLYREANRSSAPFSLAQPDALLPARQPRARDGAEMWSAESQPQHHSRLLLKQKGVAL